MFSTERLTSVTGMVCAELPGAVHQLLLAEAGCLPCAHKSTTIAIVPYQILDSFPSASVSQLATQDAKQCISAQDAYPLPHIADGDTVGMGERPHEDWSSAS